MLRAQDGSVRTFLLARVDDPRGQTAVFQAPENGPLDLVSILPGQLVSDAGFAVAMNQVSTSGGQKEFPQLFVPVAPGGIVGIRQEIQHDASGRVLLPATSAFTVTDRLGTPGPAFSNLIVRLNRLDGLLEAFALAPDPANPTGPSFVWHNKQRLTDPSLEKVPNWTTAWTKFVDDPAVGIEAFDVAPGADNLLNVVAIGKRAGVMGVFHARRAFTGAPPIPAAAAGWNSLQPLAGVDPNGGIAALRIVGGVTPVQGRRLSVFVSTVSPTDPSRRIVFNAVQTAPDSATWDSWLALPPLEAPAGRLTLAVDPTAVVVNPTVFAVTAAGRLSRSVHVASGFQPWSAVF